MAIAVRFLIDEMTVSIIGKHGGRSTPISFSTAQTVRVPPALLMRWRTLSTIAEVISNPPGYLGGPSFRILRSSGSAIGIRSSEAR
jgi:hypothetical protein